MEAAADAAPAELPRARPPHKPPPPGERSALLRRQVVSPRSSGPPGQSFPRRGSIVDDAQGGQNVGYGHSPRHAYAADPGSLTARVQLSEAARASASAAHGGARTYRAAMLAASDSDGESEFDPWDTSESLRVLSPTTTRRVAREELESNGASFHAKRMAFDASSPTPGEAGGAPRRGGGRRRGAVFGSNRHGLQEAARFVGRERSTDEQQQQQQQQQLQRANASSVPRRQSSRSVKPAASERIIQNLPSVAGDPNVRAKVRDGLHRAIERQSKTLDGLRAKTAMRVKRLNAVKDTLRDNKLLTLNEQEVLGDASVRKSMLDGSTTARVRRSQSSALSSDSRSSIGGKSSLSEMSSSTLGGRAGEKLANMQLELARIERLTTEAEEERLSMEQIRRRTDSAWEKSASRLRDRRALLREAGSVDVHMASAFLEAQLAKKDIRRQGVRTKQAKLIEDRQLWQGQLKTRKYALAEKLENDKIADQQDHNQKDVLAQMSGDLDEQGEKQLGARALRAEVMRAAGRMEAEEALALERMWDEQWELLKHHTGVDATQDMDGMLDRLFSLQSANADLLAEEEGKQMELRELRRRMGELKLQRQNAVEVGPAGGSREAGQAEPRSESEEERRLEVLCSAAGQKFRFLRRELDATNQRMLGVRVMLIALLPKLLPNIDSHRATKDRSQLPFAIQKYEVAVVSKLSRLPMRLLEKSGLAMAGVLNDAQVQERIRVINSKQGKNFRLDRHDPLGVAGHAKAKALTSSRMLQQAVQSESIQWTLDRSEAKGIRAGKAGILSAVQSSGVAMRKSRLEKSQLAKDSQATALRLSKALSSNPLAHQGIGGEFQGEGAEIDRLLTTRSKRTKSVAERKLGKYADDLGDGLESSADIVRAARKAKHVNDFKKRMLNARRVPVGKK